MYYVTESHAFRRSQSNFFHKLSPIYKLPQRGKKLARVIANMSFVHIYISVISQLQFTTILLPPRIEETIGLKVKNLAGVLISIHVLVSPNETCTWDTEAQDSQTWGVWWEVERRLLSYIITGRGETSLIK